MKVVIAGGTGFLGTALTRSLLADGHDVVVLSRRVGARSQARVVTWVPDGDTGDWMREIDGADAVVNLAGASIAEKRWTPTRKTELLDSRYRSTLSLVSAINAATRPPSVLISGSAVGYYGVSETQTFDESAPQGLDPLASICVNWEFQATQVRPPHCRVVLIRSGIVLSADGGLLKRLLFPFRLGLGGPIASGHQILSWIHLDDWVGIARWALDTPSVHGPVNATAPSAVSNATFTGALARALGRPARIPVPGGLLKLQLGEMSNFVLIQGQRVVPRKALDAGYEFRYREIDSALRALLPA